MGGTKALIDSRVKKVKEMEARETGRGQKIGRVRSLDLILSVTGRSGVGGRVGRIVWYDFMLWEDHGDSCRAETRL